MVGSAPTGLASLSRRLARSLGRCHLPAGPRAALHLVRSCATVDRLDGLTITLPDGAWFNLRPSNTESLLRLNVEATDHDSMNQLRQDVVTLLDQ